MGRQGVLKTEGVPFLGLIITKTHKVTAIGPLEIPSQGLSVAPEQCQDMEVTAFK